MGGPRTRGTLRGGSTSPTGEDGEPLLELQVVPHPRGSSTGFNAFTLGVTEQLAAQLAEATGTSPTTILTEVGALSAVQQARAREGATGSADPQQQQSHGPESATSQAEREVVWNFVERTDCFLRQVEYGDRFGLTQQQVSKAFSAWRVEAGKKPLTRKKRQKTPSNAQLARVMDMSLCCYDALKGFGYGRIAYQDESKILWGVGNHVEYGYSEAGTTVSGDFPHKASSATIILLIEFLPEPRVVKAALQPNGCQGKDCADFFNEASSHEGLPDYGSVWDELSDETKAVAMDLLGRSGKADAPQAGHFDPAIQVEGIEAGVRVVLGSPSFCLLNPIEDVNNSVQSFCARWKRPEGYYGEEDEGWEPGDYQGPQTFEEATSAVESWLEWLDEPVDEDDPQGRTNGTC